MNTVKSILSGVILLATMNVCAQDGSVKTDPAINPFSFSGYVEIYNTYDLQRPADNNRPDFIYSHNRHNEFNVNLGFLKGSYNADRVRANLAIAAGTYMNANYAAEPATLNNIYEANAGIKLSKSKNLWLDAGIFSSHIGFESAVSKDCRTLTRSMLADNSPYYESGAKLSYATDNKKWMLSGLVLNGWQRIKRVDGNSLMSVGTQVTYKPNAAATINYSTFIGTDKADTARLVRYFHNIYGIIPLTHKLEITAGFDLGMEQKVKGGNSMNTWYSPVVIARYAIGLKWAIAARGEYYADKNSVIISSVTNIGFQTAGFSFNVDYAPVQNALIRLEARTLKSKDEIFTKRNGVSDNNSFITSSVAISF